MDARRIFQTTLVHSIRPEFSLASLFLSAGIPDQARAEAVCRSLGIEPLSSGEISSDELRRVLACLLCDNLEVFDMNPRAFRLYVNESGIEMSFLEHAQTVSGLVVARGKIGGGGQDSDRGSGQPALAAQTLDGLLADSFAAGFGLYHLSESDRLHEASGRHTIELLFLFLSEGLLLVGSQHGLDSALYYGLYERLHETFVSPRIG
jgi:hypothetical protein